jgi:capsular exopolysaccharide synthesis family protein
MSRVDEAMRRAAALRDGIDQSEPDSRVVIDASILERYVPEKHSQEKPTVSEARFSRLTQVAAIAPRADGSRQPMAIPRRQEDRLVISPAVPAFIVEQYRRLAAILNDLQLQRGVKTLMVSSAAPLEGKTLTIINLALTLSESYQQRVLLIDADLRRPSVHEVLGVSNTVGLVDVVRSATLTLPSIVMSPYLSVVTAGRTDTSLLAQLASESLRAAVAHASTQFDWVLMDTPPVGLLPDAQLVARTCEAILFVVGAGVAPHEFVQRSIATLGPERIVGTVLNRMDGRNMSAGHYYDHHYPPVA